MARTKIEGGAELLAKLKKMGVDVEAALTAAAQAGATIIENDAEMRAPGPDIEQEVVKRSESRVEIAIGPGDKHWYWKYFETGAQPHEIAGPLAIPFEGELHLVGGAKHPGMKARPFLRPALDGNKDTARDAVGNVLRGKIE